MSRKEKRVGGIFRVIAAEKMIEDSSKVWDALVSPKQTVFPKSILAKNCHIYARSYPQYLMRVVEDERIENSNEIWIGEIGRKNFEICHQSDVLFSVLENFESSIPVLSDVVFEIRPRYKSLELKECDAKATIRELSRKLEHRVVTRDEIFLFKEYVLYVTELDVPWDEEEDEDALVVKDTVRGLVDSKETRIFVIKDKNAVTGKNFRLKNEARRVKTRKPRHMIELLTSDELIVPVKKKLMRPCITLTSSVLEGHGVHEIDTSVDCPRVKLDLDCCVLDRVLLCVVLGEMSLTNISQRTHIITQTISHRYLEAEWSEADFKMDLEEAHELLDAAKLLGVVGLEDLCKKRLGEFEARVRSEGVPWKEIQRRNKNDEILIVLDGMVFDVTRWMPSHPGGSSIIPKQALNMDAARMFEIYHVGAEPFLYLKQFYIGDVKLDDYKTIPRTKTEPSDAFLKHLASMTPWRVRPRDGDEKKVKDHVSF